jgi:hypothetical protein
MIRSFRAARPVSYSSKARVKSESGANFDPKRRRRDGNWTRVNTPHRLCRK